MTVVTTEPNQRLQKLLDFLAYDPGNTTLLADAALAAFDEGDPEQALNLLGQYEAISPLPAAQLNLKGLAALKRSRFDDAAAVFETLHALHPDDMILRFNLACARSRLLDHEGANEPLDEATAIGVDGAAALKIHTMHHLDLLDEALALGKDLAEKRPGDTALMAALALVASDAEDIELSRTYAAKAGDHPDGVAAMGLLLLNDNQVDESLALFDKALDARPDNPRAKLGKGMGLLLKGDAGDAAKYFDGAAESFETHLGSWISAGWAYFVQGDLAASRERFEKALAIDDTFAESHGALAVLDVLDGDVDSAKRRADVALRLDRQCLSAALAKSLLLTAKGHTRSAEKVRSTAMNMPIGPNGQTIAQAIASYGMAPGKDVKN